jgi:hypothetical protein
MKLTNKLFGYALAALLVGTCSFTAHAEKRDQSYTKTNNRSVSKSTMTISESPKHEISEEIMLGSARYTNTDFQISEEWIYSLTDQTDGSGTHKGYYTYVHKDGEQTYGTFEGSHKTVVKDDGSWLATWEGKYRYLGGSGKYKNIKGSGTYKGKEGSKEPFIEEGREQIEY